jgi:carbon monoxide dehydrogenase subunit G
VELVNEFRVPLPVAKAWELLTDPERIAPCMPGAQLLSVEGEDFHGAVKVKVGPIVAQYKGKATFVEKDTAVHRAVIKADGKESRGQGNASATVTMGLMPDGDETAVQLATDLTISGKAAQFGRGVLADVSSKLVAQFVRNLEADILASSTAAVAPEPAVAPGDAPVAVPTAEPSSPAAPARPAAAAPVVAAGTTVATLGPPTSAPKAGAAPAEAVSLVGVVAWPLLKRALPVIGAAVVAVAVWIVVRAVKG